MDRPFCFEAGCRPTQHVTGIVSQKSKALISVFFVRFTPMLVMLSRRYCFPSVASIPVMVIGRVLC